MNLFDYILPWKAIPNMIKDVKKAAKATDEDGKKNYDSIFGAIGKYADPGGALLGDKWMNFFHGNIPREVNRSLEPFTEFHREKLDPIWRLGGKRAVGGDEGDFAQITNTKSGDIAAAIGGMVAGGMALGGGAAGGGGSGGGSGFNMFSKEFWQNPQNWSRMMPNSQQQQPQQPQRGPVMPPPTQPVASTVGQYRVTLNTPSGQQPVTVTARSEEEAAVVAQKIYAARGGFVAPPGPSGLPDGGYGANVPAGVRVAGVRRTV